MSRLFEQRPTRSPTLLMQREVGQLPTILSDRAPRRPSWRQRVAFGDGPSVRLHRECEDAFIGRRMHEEGVP
jgi:hypothetical protein